MTTTNNNRPFAKMLAWAWRKITRRARAGERTAPPTYPSDTEIENDIMLRCLEYPDPYEQW